MADKKWIVPSVNNKKPPQINDRLDDGDKEKTGKKELSIYGLAAQLKNIITKSRMERAKRKKMKE